MASSPYNWSADLPADVLGLILGNFLNLREHHDGDTHRLVAACFVNKRFSSVTRNLLLQEKISNKSQLVHAAFSHALLENHFSLAKWVHETFPHVRWPSWVCARAAREGRLDVLQWAFDNKDNRWDEIVCSSAAAGGHLEVLQWLRTKNCSWDSSTLAAAARAGHLHVVRWAIDHGCPFDESVCASAAARGLPLLKLARSCGVPWDASTCMCAAEAGDLDALQWAREHHCPWDTSATNAATRSGHQVMLNWLLGHQCPSNARSRFFPGVGDEDRYLDVVTRGDPIPAECYLSDFIDAGVRHGRDASCHLSRYIPTGQIWCLKRTSKRLLRGVVRSAEQVGSLWKKLRHPLVLPVFAILQDERYWYLVSPHIGFLDLDECLQRSERLSSDVARFYVAETLLALEYLHKRNIAYRDLKPSQVLIDSAGHIQLACSDFAEELIDHSKKQASFVGTPEYLAPEIPLRRECDVRGADYWALGILTYELLVGVTPFRTDTEHTVFEHIIHTKPTFPSYLDPFAKDFISKLLQPKQEDRLGCGVGGVEDAKQHPWFYGIDWDALLLRKIPPPAHL